MYTIIRAISFAAGLVVWLFRRVDTPQIRFADNDNAMAAFSELEGPFENVLGELPSGAIGGLFRRVDVTDTADDYLGEIALSLRKSKCRLHIRSVSRGELQHQISDFGASLVDDFGDAHGQIARGDG